MKKIWTWILAKIVYLVDLLSAEFLAGYIIAFTLMSWGTSEASTAGYDSKNFYMGIAAVAFLFWSIMSLAASFKLLTALFKYLSENHQ
jgi:hypothetical protein